MWVWVWVCTNVWVRGHIHEELAAATATLATYSYSKTLGGCINLSGWLPDREAFSVAPANSTTPMFWGHGRTDPVIAIEMQTAGCEVLSKLGVNCLAKVRPDLRPLWGMKMTR